MNSLTSAIWIEKYRPQSFQELILRDKELLINSLKNPTEIPSFIFHSIKPGTGKTSTAKLVIKYLNCDSIVLNGSDERGIDTIREKIDLFSRTASFNMGRKKCIFFDESDALTKPAQDCLRNLMEEYSTNCFFIFSCNDLGKMIEPIRSRCLVIDFSSPNRKFILERITEISCIEELKFTETDLKKLVDYYYPDMRSMIMTLQKAYLDKKPLTIETEKYEKILVALKKKDINYLYTITYNGEVDLLGFNHWFFDYLFKNYSSLVVNMGIDRLSKIGLLLAEIEKSYNLGVNLPVVFLANMVEISKTL